LTGFLTEREGHDSLVNNDGDEDRHEFPQFFLKSDGQAFEERVEGQGNDEEDGSKGGVVEDVGPVAVLMLVMLLMVLLMVVLKCELGGVKFEMKDFAKSVFQSEG
jgi:hypothetical protein